MPLVCEIEVMKPKLLAEMSGVDERLKMSAARFEIPSGGCLFNR